MRVLFLALLFLSMAHVGQADELKLLSGKTLEGKIVEQTDKYVKFDEGEGIALTYYNDDIASINGKPMVIVHPAPVAVVDNQPASAPVVDNQPALVPVADNQQASVPVVDNSSTSVETTNTEIKPQVSTVSIVQATNFSNQTNMRIRPKINTGGLLLVIGIFFVFIFFIYALICAPLSILAKKFDVNSPWMAWVPFVNIYLNCKLAGRPGWWFLLCLVPLANIIIYVILWMDISERCNKPRWVGILMVVPFVNIFLTWYLALLKETPVIKL